MGLLLRLIVGALLVVALVPIDGGPASAAARAGAELEEAARRASAVARGESPGASSEAAAVGEPSSTVTYIGYPSGPVPPGGTVTIPVALRNRDVVTWPAAGEEAVRLSYHLYDAAGRVVAWDGVRSSLPSDLPAGGGEVVPMTVAVPALTGIYTVKPDLVRDGVGWFSAQGAEAGSFPLRVTTDLDAGYGATTAPAAIIPGAWASVDVRVSNTGLKSWPAGGDAPVRLGYHWLDGNGDAVVWDGARISLPYDLAPGRELSLRVDVRAPDYDGDYLLVWDMVQDGGIGWFSGHAVPTKTEIVAVWSGGVTIYGKGWGHGVGLSQWGAQGWAVGAAGVRLNGEQIVARYFPGAHLAHQPITQPFRVLLSAPSTGCVGQTIGSVARMRSAGGMRLVNNADPNTVYIETAPDQPLRFWYDGGSLVVRDEWSGQIVFSDPDTLVLMPKQWWDPIYIDQKGLSYRGNLQIGLREEGNLRVVNFVSSDDYMRGALPGEMPSHWEFEALRAQAIAARTYAAWRQSTAGDRTWDVRDDTADQCYGGHTFETSRTSAAVEATASLILTYEGKPIRALYSSASGGISENVGCVLDAARIGGTWQCVPGWPYLQVTEDPAEIAAYDRRGEMPHGLWSTHFSGEVIRREIIIDYGVDIGHFVSMQFNMSPGGRPISVRVQGSDTAVDLKGDRFLRTTLGLKSTLVRTTPF
ncbi:MAG TPA: SpoIID/LytB domain-containing protein [Candidatus Limnocylindria bacterium]|nr:SpoIID/LytB domain-containing protein [Candidatus Limnocylindria bacterium]